MHMHVLGIPITVALHHIKGLQNQSTTWQSHLLGPSWGACGRQGESKEGRERVPFWRHEKQAPKPSSRGGEGV